MARLYFASGGFPFSVFFNSANFAWNRNNSTFQMDSLKCRISVRNWCTANQFVKNISMFTNKVVLRRVTGPGAITPCRCVQFRKAHSPSNWFPLNFATFTGIETRVPFDPLAVSTLRCITDHSFEFYCETVSRFFLFSE